jgi:uncharacterized phage-associated protein
MPLREVGLYDSITIANRILDHAKKSGDTLTPMQLLKLVFLAHGWSLALLGRPLINDRIEAWQYGPVIPRLYAAVREFRSSPVVGPLRADKRETLDDDEEEIVRQTYENYGRLSGPALSRLTHESGSPWSKTYRDGAFGLYISNDLIKDHFARLAAMEQSE